MSRSDAGNNYLRTEMTYVPRELQSELSMI